MEQFSVLPVMEAEVGMEKPGKFQSREMVKGVIQKSLG